MSAIAGLNLKLKGLRRPLLAHACRIRLRLKLGSSMSSSSLTVKALLRYLLHEQGLLAIVLAWTS